MFLIFKIFLIEHTIQENKRILGYGENDLQTIDICVKRPPPELRWEFGFTIMPSLLTTKKSPLSEGRFGAPLDTRGYPMVYLLDSKDAV